MSEWMTCQDAVEDVQIAFRQLEFSMKLLSFCELGKLTAADFGTDHIVRLDDGDLHFPAGHLSANGEMRPRSNV
jgi:hypothetical protein